MKLGRILLTGGLIYLIYKLGDINGRVSAHEGFVKKYGNAVFQNESKIETVLVKSIFTNAKIISLKKENV